MLKGVLAVSVDPSSWSNCLGLSRFLMSTFLDSFAIIAQYEDKCLLIVITNLLKVHPRLNRFTFSI